jgi:hypothetical protein
MSNTSKEKVEAILQEIEENIEGFKIISKNDHDWYKCLWTATLAWAFFNVVGFFSKKTKESFLDNFVTVFDGRIVAFPRGTKFKNLYQPIVYETLRRTSLGLHEPSYDSLKKMSDYLENPFNHKDFLEHNH